MESSDSTELSLGPFACKENSDENEMLIIPGENSDKNEVLDWIIPDNKPNLVKMLGNIWLVNAIIPKSNLIEKAFN